MNLLTPEEYEALPDGTRLENIFGAIKTKGVDYIDQDIRGGYIAFGLAATATESEKVLADSEWIASDGQEA